MSGGIGISRFINFRSKKDPAKQAKTSYSDRRKIEIRSVTNNLKTKLNKNTVDRKRKIAINYTAKVDFNPYNIEELKLNLASTVKKLGEKDPTYLTKLAEYDAMLQTANSKINQKTVTAKLPLYIDENIRSKIKGNDIIPELFKLIKFGYYNEAKEFISDLSSKSGIYFISRDKSMKIGVIKIAERNPIDSENKPISQYDQFGLHFQKNNIVFDRDDILKIFEQARVDDREDMLVKTVENIFEPKIESKRTEKGKSYSGFDLILYFPKMSSSLERSFERTIIRKSKKINRINPRNGNHDKTNGDQVNSEGVNNE
ncbi:MAG: hypothetical protein HeimC2_13340 [Candidatus Heimdallarchaeota archaeon LC_2]|nr:MAG: hypothetical protein HeimC2_13340 [Candidatus Heimdallarchaeota archaeon LC_2]